MRAPAIPLLALALTAAAAPPPPSAAVPAANLDSGRPESNRLDFNKDVRPILSDRCFACHGPDSGTRKAGLRLDTPEGAYAALSGGGHAIVPGDLDASEAATRIRSSDPDDVMPPPELKRPLTDEERATLLRWIEPHPSLRNPGSLIVASGVSFGSDRFDQPVVLFPNDWTMGYFQEKNPDLRLRELPLEQASAS